MRVIPIAKSRNPVPFFGTFLNLVEKNHNLELDLIFRRI